VNPTRLGADPLAFCAAELVRLDEAELRRRVRTLDSGSEPEVVVDGRRLLHLASNNYLGLATHPEVTAAAAEAAARWGAGSGSARLITGGFRLHEDLEATLARFKACADAVLFSSGYLANLGTISALVGRADAVFSDALNHASIIDGARLSRAEVAVYEHGDGGHLDDLLAAWRLTHAEERALVVTDSVFSMDGDLAPLPELLEVCRRHGAVLMVDEAHATGVVGPGGGGAVAHFGLEGQVPVVMGTLSKALGAAGGFVAGSEALCDFLRNRARSFIFDTATAPPAAAAAGAALGVLEREPARPARARALARRLAGGLSAAGYPVAAPAAAIVPVLVGEPGAALALSQSLLEQGILVTAIRPPSVPPGTARLRATVMATHTDDQIDRAIEAFAALRQ
jgi:8-amino-7-oxononanoate synthase